VIAVEAETPRRLMATLRRSLENTAAERSSGGRGDEGDRVGGVLQLVDKVSVEIRGDWWSRSKG
jgi:hypothetical protein